jgi:hypothetical protein
MSRARKYEVYSWRLSTKLKSELEAAARDEKASIDTILDRLVREWLEGRARNAWDDHERLGHWGLMEGASRYRTGRKSLTKKDDPEQRRSHERREAKRAPRGGAKTEQAGRAALMACAGIFKGDGTSATNERVREAMGEYLEAKYGRRHSR